VRAACFLVCVQVTYNTLIDVFGKTNQAEEAVKVLDTLEAQVRPCRPPKQRRDQRCLTA
jgi:pentatricopeptide repeat protein